MQEKTAFQRFFQIITPYSLLCTKEGSTLVLLSLYFIRVYAAYHRPQKKNIE